jgi:transcriptional regulator with XRE-family HTH domain
MARGDAVVPIGAYVAALRKQKGISLNKAAVASGIAKATLLRLEQNKRDAQLTTLKGIAKGLGITFIIGPEGVFIEDGQK